MWIQMFLKTRDPVGLLKLYKEAGLLMRTKPKVLLSITLYTDQQVMFSVPNHWPHSNLNKNISLSLCVFVELLYTTHC